ncbi:MAG TPA: DNA helicase RecQ [Pirellulales bacterium]|jgi:ATP-dependent DNA helicase RecQ|nr:DNA helicase RecQ [Pirellulales bacterium]
MSTAAVSPVPAVPDNASGTVPPAVLATIRRFWGFQQLRPFQAEAIEAALTGRDSLVVLPTGGGKSLCYQAPPAMTGGTDVVISPLISLMKDQVDGLRECGYPAAALHSGIENEERRNIEQSLLRGEYRLLFVAPERAVTPWFLNMAQRLNVRRFAIDEAHCISHWGHDFRPEYRQLAKLREQFPQASLHAFTATATLRVREDVIRQLNLRDPAVLVGSFDRPNLVYRVLPQVDVYGQSIEVVRRYAGEAVIVYCLTRKDAECVAAVLNANGIQAAAYHAGLDPAVRHQVQDAFAAEKLNVVVATVAFGMGIDRSNVRCVLHTAMPKTVEHYQQETGRAGRDGLEAECVLLYSFADAMRWDGLIHKSAADAENPGQFIEAQQQLLQQMQRLCNSPRCRHRALVEYFGQPYERENCGACDVCLADVETVEDGTVAAQKILSCVARVEERFGVGHVVDVLTGANTEMIRNCRHEQLSTYGLLREVPKKHVQSMVYQLVDQGLLDRTPGERPLLKLNAASREVLRGQREVKLLRPKQTAPTQAQVDADSWEGVDRDLFERLRTWRLDLAHERQVPPYLVLDDASLRSLARIRPTRLELLKEVRGIGEKRLADFGAGLVELVRHYCAEYKIDADQIAPTSVSALGGSAGEPQAAYIKPKLPNAVKSQAFELFRQRWSIDDVKHKINRARSTTCSYLVEFIAEEKPPRIDCWVSDEIYRQVTAAAAQLEARRLSPVFERLDGRVPYDLIRLVLAHVESVAQ